MEWESNLCIMLLLTLMLKDLVNLIHGAITLDSAKLRAILMMLLVEGKVISQISSMLYLSTYYLVELIHFLNCFCTCFVVYV